MTSIAPALEQEYFHLSIKLAGTCGGLYKGPLKYYVIKILTIMDPT